MARAAGTWPRQRSCDVAAVALLLLFCWSAVSSVSEKSATCDEIAHVTAGYCTLLTGDYRLDPEGGLLSNCWVALPLWFTFDKDPARTAGWHKSVSIETGLALFPSIAADPSGPLWGARCMVVVLGAALGLCVYLWSRRLNGPLGGLLSLLVFVLSPNVLAHSRLATSDMAVSLWLTVTVACLWRLCHRVGAANLGLSALCLGLALLSKFSSLMIIPIAGLLCLVRVFSPTAVVVDHAGRAGERAIAGGSGESGERVVAGGSGESGERVVAGGSGESGERVVASGRGKALVLVASGLAVFLGAAMVVWLAYGVRFSPTGGQSEHLQWEEELADGGVAATVIAFARDARLAPEPWLFGLAHTVGRLGGRHCFAAGRWSTGGWWWFFPYAFLIKTPLATLALFLAAVAAIFLRFGGNDGFLYRSAPMWATVVVVWGFLLTSGINIGYRHALPCFAAGAILAGRAAWWLEPGRGGARVVMVLLVAGLAIESWSIRPHYLAFFNAAAGGPRQGYRHLVDSSLDWGQDVAGFARWVEGLRRRGYQGSIHAAFFSPAPPWTYRLKGVHWLGAAPGTERYDIPHLREGVYCVSAQVLQGMARDYPFRPPWTAEEERGYRDIIARIRAFAGGPDDPRLPLVASDDEHQEARGKNRILLVRYEAATLGRLCAYLRQREPDEHVGYSILVYWLRQPELSLALDGPLRELD